MNTAFGMMPLTPVVKRLLIINVGIWFIGQVLIEGLFLGTDYLGTVFSLVPEQVLFKGSSVTHILFNMLMLWFFGSELEQKWGSKFFTIYYFVCGVGAAVIYILGLAFSVLFFKTSSSSLMIPVVGASGAIFGLLLAYGMLFGERMMFFMMLFPMKAKYFVMLMGFIEFVSLIQTRERGSDVAYLAHLGGLAAGLLFLKSLGWWRRYVSNKTNKQRHRNLKLVVDNEKKSNQGPKYWN
jgi:membrane associated rhomboid family serine protease